MWLMPVVLCPGGLPRPMIINHLPVSRRLIYRSARFSFGEKSGSLLTGNVGHVRQKAIPSFRRCRLLRVADASVAVRGRCDSCDSCETNGQHCRSRMGSSTNTREINRWARARESCRVLRCRMPLAARLIGLSGVHSTSKSGPLLRTPRHAYREGYRSVVTLCEGFVTFHRIRTNHWQ